MFREHPGLIVTPQWCANWVTLSFLSDPRRCQKQRVGVVRRQKTAAAVARRLGSYIHERAPAPDSQQIGPNRRLVPQLDQMPELEREAGPEGTLDTCDRQTRTYRHIRTLEFSCTYIAQYIDNLMLEDSWSVLSVAYATLQETGSSMAFDLTADDGKIDSVCNYPPCKSTVISGPGRSR
jgi:hypothetical protein